MDLFHSREWVLSIVQAVSSLQVTRRIFRKTWSSSTVKTVLALFSVLFSMNGSIIQKTKDFFKFRAKAFYTEKIGR